jgi:hypothetical protein
VSRAGIGKEKILVAPKQSALTFIGNPITLAGYGENGINGKTGIGRLYADVQYWMHLCFRNKNKHGGYTKKSEDSGLYLAW